jgi:hypothetical protein
MRGLTDDFVAANDGLVTFEDPVDIYRGYLQESAGRFCQIVFFVNKI